MLVLVRVLVLVGITLFPTAYLAEVKLLSDRASGCFGAINLGQ